MADQNELEKLYREARSALKTKEYDRAAGLLTQILVIDEDYRDVSRLLAQTVKLKRRRWYNHPATWGTLGALLLLGFGLFITPKISSFYAAQSPAQIVNATSTPFPTVTAAPTQTLLPTPTPIPLTWKRIYGGDEFRRAIITAIVVDPRDPDVIYVGTESAGIYKSIDGGISWQPAHIGLERANIGTLIIDPSEPTTLYAGVVLGGIYKTTDGTKTWHPINSGIELPGGEWLSIVVMDPQNNRHLYFTQRSYLYESLDAGETWQKIQFPACMRDISNLAMDPKDGKFIFIMEFNGNNPFNCPVGIYKSEDGGENWTQIPITITEKEFAPKSLAIDTWNPNKIFFSEWGGALWGSFDGGNTWKKIMDDGCSTIAFDPTDQNRTYCGGSAGLWVSKGLGTQLSKVNIPEANVTAIAFSPLAPKVLLAGGAGLYISRDEGKSWNTQNSGLGGSIVQLKIDPSNVSNLYGEDSDSQTYISTDNGHTWSQSQIDTSYLNPTALPFGDCQPVFGYLSSDGQTGYGIGCMASSSFRTNDGGKTWDKCNQSDDSNIWVSRSLTRLAIDPRDNNKLIIASRGNGILMSADGCQSWQFSNAGLGSLFVNSVAIDPNNPNNVYAGTDGGGYISSDGGQTWGQINDGLLGATVVYSIVVDKESNVYAATPYGIFKLEKK